jgi:hypothetical protein
LPEIKPAFIGKAGAMEKAKRVFVYEDPVSCLRLEGVATLVKKISSDHWSERWLVRFDNGDEVERTINKRRR